MSDALELKTAIEAQGRAWEEFKKANDSRLAAIEGKGYAPSDLVEKVATISADLDKHAKAISDVQRQMERPNAGTGTERAEQTQHKQAFDSYLRKGIVEGLADLERKAMNSTSDPDGGYLIPMAMEQAIDRIVPTLSAMFRLARNVNIGTRSYQKRVKVSGMSMTRVAEGAGAGETTEPTFARMELTAYPAEVEPWVNNETLEDADIDLAADLAQEAAIGFAEGAGSEFIAGDGVNKARGITKYSTVANASYTNTSYWGSVGYIASGKAGAFASSAPADKIVSLYHALKPQYRPGAAFIMSDATLGTVRQMKDGSGTYYLWQPDPLAGFGGRLLGVPVEVDDNMPAVASNAYSVAFGNWDRAYLIVNRTGTSLIRDNLTTKGVTKFNFRRRFGGGVYNFEALKLMKMAAS